MSPSAAERPLLRLRKGEERRLRAGHLWVFSNEIDSVATPLGGFEPGGLVQLVSHRDQPLGTAYLNPATLIAARLLCRDSGENIDRRWFAARLRTALILRECLYPTPHYRAVFGESDGLPGLILDRFGDVLVGQIGTLGMERLRGEIEAAIETVFSPRVFVWKNDSGARSLEGLPEEVSAVRGEMPNTLEVVERVAGRELALVAALPEGQKTGWFYDQAFNRSLLPRFLPAGARVLDVCSYVGAWSAAALVAGASSLTCIDSSAAALGYAGDNLQRTAAALARPMPAPRLVQQDAFDGLAALSAAGERFDAVIVDPPAFIKRRKDAPAGQAAYRKLNQLALRLLEPEGLLVSCSCSYHLAPEELLAAIQSAARHVDRHVQLLHFGGQSPDHPVHPAIPETRYLKSFFCRVTRA